MEWYPNIPRHLSKKELKQYRAGRDAAMAELLKLMGGSGAGLIVEV
jgi:hypothetical protein